MKKILISAVIAASCFAPQAFAQAKNFEGFSAAVNMDLIANSTKGTILGSNYVDGLGRNSVGASIQAAYSYAATDKIVLSVGGTYNLTDTNGVHFTSSSFTADSKLKDAYSIYFEPGYALTDKTLAYAKVSYEAGKAVATYSDGSPSESTDLSGVGAGFGLRTFIDKNLYLQVEAMQKEYKTATAPGTSNPFKSKSTSGSIGLGYKF